LGPGRQVLIVDHLALVVEDARVHALGMHLYFWAGANRAVSTTRAS
jgi:hypothetical protein